MNELDNNERVRWPPWKAVRFCCNEFEWIE